MSRFIIKALQSDSPELPNQLPATGYTVDVLTDSRGASTYRAVLDAPLRFYVDSEFDSRRIAPDRLGRDAQGPFLWVSEVVLSPHRVDQHPYPGMRNFEMDMAAVLNPPDFDGAVLDPTSSLRWASPPSTTPRVSPLRLSAAAARRPHTTLRHQPWSTDLLPSPWPEDLLTPH